MSTVSAEVAAVLPRDAADALLVGRVWDPASRGPRIVAVLGQHAVDISDIALTVSALLERDDLLDTVRAARDDPSRSRFELAELIAADPTDDSVARLLAPIDLQVIKACGVTFADSMIERLIEERSGGDPTLATQLRSELVDRLGVDVAAIVPGSPEALQAKAVLQQRGLWSQYLEVGIGPDPEVFTKAPVLSAVGFGEQLGIPHSSTWNNPEPELVLIVDSHARVRGATLGNDVNLRDIEGRSALLLGVAKDNNGSTAIGPFIRLCDDAFSLEHLRSIEIGLEVVGEDGYRLRGVNSLSRISRPFETLVAATCGAHHQYPDGFALFTGTLFAPTDDRDEPGLGFTHKLGDVVSISSGRLGLLRNPVGRSEEIPPWRFGIGALLSRLSAR